MLESNNSNKSRIGDIVEYKAIVWLLNQGFEVFKNVSRVGLIDMIYLNKELGVFKRIDVKKVVDGTRKTVRVSHPRHTQAQQELEVDFLYYDEKNDFFSWTTTDIYSNMGKLKQIRQIEPVVIVDQTFPSLTAACRHYKVKDRTVREWLRTHSESTLEQAINHALNNAKSFVFDGKEYTDKKQACKDLGLSLRVVEYWIYEKGYTVEDAINEAIKRKPAKTRVRKPQTVNDY